jgi:hypothetical protein
MTHTTMSIGVFIRKTAGLDATQHFVATMSLLALP